MTTDTAAAPDQDPSSAPFLIPASPTAVLAGVSACGTTRVGTEVARRLGIVFVDGGDLHQPGNVRKMAFRVSLTDVDRWPWLDRIGAVLRDRGAHPCGIVLACSALRRIYRDRIQQVVRNKLVFVFFDETPDEAGRRIRGREAHYMSPSLLHNHFAVLVRPDGGSGCRHHHTAR